MAAALVDDFGLDADLAEAGFADAGLEAGLALLAVFGFDAGVEDALDAVLLAVFAFNLDAGFFASPVMA